MTEYAFDVKLWAVARVEAATVAEARAKLANYADCLDIGMVTPDGVKFTEASSEGEFDLFEVDGKDIHEGEEEADDDDSYPPPCPGRSDHSWVISDETDRSYCAFCGADGDA